MDPNAGYKEKLRTLDSEIRNHLRFYITICENVVFRHMENLQHQLIVTPTLVPLSASLTARNRTHAHVVKTGFGLSLVCFSLLGATTFWFLCDCCVFCSFPIRDYLYGSVSGSGSGSGSGFGSGSVSFHQQTKNFQAPDFNCFMTS